MPKQRTAWISPFPWDPALVLSFFFLGLLVNLNGIERASVWGDEAFTILTSQLPFRNLTDKLVDDFVHPPLHYYLLHIWFKSFGASPWQARLPSAIFGALAVVLVYAIGKHLSGRRTGIVAALLMMLSQIGVIYGQEARPYAMQLFLLLGSLLLSIIAADRRSLGAWIGFTVVATLAVMTHYYSLFAVAILFFYAWARRESGVPGRWIAWSIAVVALNLGLWLNHGVLEQFVSGTKVVSSAQPAWFAVSARTPVQVLHGFNNGFVSGVFRPPPLWAFPVGLVLLTFPAAAAVWRCRAKDPHNVMSPNTRPLVLLLAALVIVPPLALITLGSMGLQFDPRYVAHCVAPYFLLVAHGHLWLRRKWLRGALLAITLAYSAVSLRAVYDVPYKEDYQAAVAYLTKEYRPGDCVVFLPFHRVPPVWWVYHDQIPSATYTRLAHIRSGRPTCLRLWAVSYRRTMGTANLSDDMEADLAESHTATGEANFFWVRVRLYLPRAD